MTKKQKGRNCLEKLESQEVLALNTRGCKGVGDNMQSPQKQKKKQNGGGGGVAHEGKTSEN